MNSIKTTGTEGFREVSKFLLLSFLKEPGGFSFFPSSMFWNQDISQQCIQDSYRSISSDDVGQDIKHNLYIHIPFCSKICSYCNCFKEQLTQRKQIDIYLDYIEREAEIIYQQSNKKKIGVHSIFIGGGTPNILSVTQFKRLYTIIESYYDISILEQFLIDGHPNFYTAEKIKYFASIGVTRLTFAVQSFDGDVLSINNRDVYNIETMKLHLELLNQYKISSNIDLLIGISGQNLVSIKNDIHHLNLLKVDNVSVHYFMQSNNIKYQSVMDFQDFVTQAKKIVKNANLPSNVSNIQEDFFASQKSSTISLGACGVTNIYAHSIFIKPEREQYYNMIDTGNIPYLNGCIVSQRDEMIKYIYLNILDGIDIQKFYQLFSIDLFHEFFPEFQFLHKHKIIYIKNKRLYSQKNDQDTFIYFNIFFKDKFVYLDKSKYNLEELNCFFLENGDLIDR